MATPPPKKQRTAPPPIQRHVEDVSTPIGAFVTTGPVFQPQYNQPLPFAPVLEDLPTFTTEILPKSGNLHMYRPVARRPS